MTKKTQKKLRKALLLISCAALLVCITVGVTVAYLTDSANVKNTFTVGNVTITMDEQDVNLYGEPATPAVRDNGNEYKLIPGHTYTKDPIIHVDPASEECYLFVKINNGISAIEATGDTTIDAQMAKNGWVAITGETGVYYYNKFVEGGENVPVFGSFTLANDANVANYATEKDEETGKPVEGATVIDVTAYAVQKDGFFDADDEAADTDAEAAVAAWNATKNDF